MKDSSNLMTTCTIFSCLRAITKSDKLKKLIKTSNTLVTPKHGRIIMGGVGGVTPLFVQADAVN
jgi:hypothetical protein